MAKATNRTINGYTEVHHVIPKCMGGDDSNSNLVRLSAREHFIAHMLLVKIYPGHHGLVKAVVMMCCGQYERKINNRIYEWVKLKLAAAMSASQTGCKNSQFGSCWIHNPATLEVKKIPKDSNLPDGWIFGRAIKLECMNMPSKKEFLKARNREKYIEYYNVYQNHGFDEFKIITEYKFSKENLVQMFSRHVPNFVPQNGKKRGT